MRIAVKLPLYEWDGKALIEDIAERWGPSPACLLKASYPRVASLLVIISLLSEHAFSQTGSQGGVVASYQAGNSYPGGLTRIEFFGVDQ
jgi:hypothetical protein